MKYLRLEEALNSLVGLGQLNGPFYGMAGALKNIIENNKDKSEKIADELATFIKQATKNIEKNPPYLTIEEYAKWRGVSQWYVRKLCREKKLISKKIGGHWIIE